MMVWGWNYFFPFLTLFLGTLGVHGYGRLVKNENPFICRAIAAISALSSVFFIGLLRVPVQTVDGLLVFDLFGQASAVLILFSLLIAVYFIPFKSEPFRFSSSSVTSLLLLAALGALIMVFSNHLIVFFVGLELFALIVCVLVCLGVNEAKSSEASFKMFVVGGVGAALFLFGSALIWASVHTMSLVELDKIYGSLLHLTLAKPFWFGMALVCSALFAKLGAFPFHFWKPDECEAAPASINGWVQVTIKISVVGFLLRLLHALPSEAVGQSIEIGVSWKICMLVLAILTMLWGSIGGLLQKNIKRLMGYSSIMHVGFMLMFLAAAIGASRALSNKVIFYYLTIYTLADLLLYCLISKADEHKMVDVDSFSGLVHRRADWALLMAVGVLSLAGIAPMGGFFAKFQLFSFVYGQGFSSVVVFAVLASLVSAGYYIRILSKVFFHPLLSDELLISKQQGVQWMLVLVCFILIAVGVYPQWLLHWFL